MKRTEIYETLCVVSPELNGCSLLLYESWNIFLWCSVCFHLMSRMLSTFFYLHPLCVCGVLGKSLIKNVMSEKHHRVSCWAW